jgi:hypothetical protein
LVETLKFLIPRVFYDINVPLFLPLYAERRLYDLRLIRNLERRLNKKVKGQINFSSGINLIELNG